MRRPSRLRQWTSGPCGGQLGWTRPTSSGRNAKSSWDQPFRGHHHLSGPVPGGRVPADGGASGSFVAAQQTPPWRDRRACSERRLPSSPPVCIMRAGRYPAIRNIADSNCVAGACPHGELLWNVLSPYPRAFVCARNSAWARPIPIPCMRVYRAYGSPRRQAIHQERRTS